MEIREATAADAEAIRRVHRASIEGLGSAAYDPKQVAAWARGTESADYAAAIESDDRYFAVAEGPETGDESEGEADVLGFGSVHLEPPAEYEASVNAEVTAVYVHPRVARRGVGTELLVAVEREARNRDIGTLGLSASLNARAFYEHHGYDRARSYDHEFSESESTGVTGEVVEMAKSL